MSWIQKWIQKLYLIRLLSLLYRAKVVRLLLPVAIVLFVYWEGQKEFRTINWGAAIHELQRLQPSTLLFLFGFSLIAVSVMNTYDWLIRKHFRLDVSYWDVFKFGWIANTSNNMIGFAGLTGAGLRTFLYRNRGVPLSSIAAAVAFLTTITFTGLSILAWLSITGVFAVHELLEAHPWLTYALWATALYLPLFVLLQRTSLFSKWFNRSQGVLKPKTFAAALSSSTLEWLFAGLAFWLIGHTILDSLSLQQALGIYTMAAIAGIVSMAPGGIGGFDIIAILGLQLLGYPPEKCAVVLVLFRLLYYIIPWLIGLIMAAFEIPFQRKRLDQGELSMLDRAFNVWQTIWGWPRQLGFVGEIGAWSLGKLVFAAGVILLLSAATPGMLYRIHYMEQLLSLPLMRLSHQLSVIIGIMLIVLSRGISLRVKRAYYWTLVLLCAGAIFTLAKGFDYEEAIYLLIVALLLWVSRHRFYRLGMPLGRYNILGGALVTIVIVYGYYLVSSHTHPAFLMHLPPRAHASWLLEPKEHTIVAVFSLLIAWLMLSLLYLFQPKPLSSQPNAEDEQLKLQVFLETEQGNLLTHMLFTGDKRFFWACNNRVMLPYAKIRNKLVVLGDPLGPETFISEAIQQFQTFADEFALEVVFYQAAPSYLPCYHENGYRFFKLGEEALVDLERFTLVGKQNAHLRTVKNRFEREGFQFEMAQPPHHNELLKQLALISNQWLAGKQEKGYSLGWFDENYLQLAPIALLRNQENQIIAFASLAYGYDDATLSVDLMRYLKQTPNGTMDQLFICILEWAKAEGYKRFNLGMAPLSSVGQHQKAIKEEKLARILFQRGSSWYSFVGLRRYKEKFSPEWEPRYLAYPASTSLPLLLVDLIRLISRKPEKSKNPQSH
ncbi:bifunctional lysylphosphatidylglycerol flippase/synthetase MprF [Paenibacillus sinopodophylli]|uniref:bifunctional lysylphosphatidylglycerol flippase/synthetase MprF n=1 Tax=Paenibacillus sinopodophylli TaxID=1837342 RepID=UPI00110C9EEA|nr:bifunctional lysylphosphatidylglycerol flippase/synthetase MprF [Paenibacillus sinopodophylli]